MVNAASIRCAYRVQLADHRGNIRLKKTIANNEESQTEKEHRLCESNIVVIRCGQKHAEMPDRHQDAANKNSPSVAPITVRHITANERCQINQTGVVAINFGRQRFVEQQGFNHEQCEDGAHAVVAETLPHFGKKQEV